MRNLFFALLLLPMLQACFPVVATGFGAGVLMADDRRSSGIYIEDENIELKAGSRVGDIAKDNAHINITSFNRLVLLTGEVASEEVKREIENVVREIPNVKNVQNELVVAGVSSMLSRSNDSYLTSKVKMRFIDGQKFNANHVKVITESNVVYLLGLVKRQEGEDAAAIAASTSGVQRVVKVFEYLD
ncbi:MAG: BON domain-containing protein [Pseudomonadota bacterium]